MPKYIQNTTDYNITNQNIASIHELVNKVKHKKEVSISYMKSWEVEEMAKKEGYREGIHEMLFLRNSEYKHSSVLKYAKHTL